jgi:hypothetical protein
MTHLRVMPPAAMNRPSHGTKLPPPWRHTDGNSPPTTIQCPSTSTSSVPAPRCSPTQSPGASTPHLSQHHRFPFINSPPPWASPPGEPLPSPSPKAGSTPHRLTLDLTPPSLTADRDGAAGPSPAPPWCTLTATPCL